MILSKTIGSVERDDEYLIPFRPRRCVLSREEIVKDIL